MQAYKNAARYDWETWLVGIWRSIIQGGSSGVVAGPIAIGIDPQHFNLSTGLGHTIEMIGGVFIGAAIIAMFTFLQTHGTPDKVLLQQALTDAADANKQAGVAIESAKASSPTSEK